VFAWRGGGEEGGVYPYRQFKLELVDYNLLAIQDGVITVVHRVDVVHDVRAGDKPEVELAVNRQAGGNPLVGSQCLLSLTLSQVRSL
jgi:hypothetical protein